MTRCLLFDARFTPMSCLYSTDPPPPRQRQTDRREDMKASSQWRLHFKHITHQHCLVCHPGKNCLQIDDVMYTLFFSIIVPPLHQQQSWEQQQHKVKGHSGYQCLHSEGLQHWLKCTTFPFYGSFKTEISVCTCSSNLLRSFKHTFKTSMSSFEDLLLFLAICSNFIILK